MFKNNSINRARVITCSINMVIIYLFNFVRLYEIYKEHPIIMKFIPSTSSERAINIPIATNVISG